MKFNRPYLLTLILIWTTSGSLYLYYPNPGTILGLMAGLTLGYLSCITYNRIGEKNV